MAWYINLQKKKTCPIFLQYRPPSSGYVQCMTRFIKGSMVGNLNNNYSKPSNVPHMLGPPPPRAYHPVYRHVRGKFTIWRLLFQIHLASSCICWVYTSCSYRFFAVRIKGGNQMGIEWKGGGSAH